MRRREFIQKSTQKFFGYLLLTFAYSACTSKTSKSVEETPFSPSEAREDSGSWIRTNSEEDLQNQVIGQNGELPGPWGSLYLVQTNPYRIVQLEFPSLNNMTSLVKLDEAVSGLVVHHQEQKLYWIEGPTIQSANLDGSKRELIFVSRNPNWWPYSLAILPSEDKLYYIYRDSQNKGRAIGEVRTNGQGERKILDLRGDAKELVIHPKQSKIFWTEQLPDQIYSADLDGKNIKVLIRTIDAEHIALDEFAEKIYWNDRLGLRRINWNGSRPELLGKPFYQSEILLDIAIDGFNETLYWSNGKRIFQGDLEGNVLRTFDISATLLKLG